MTDPRHRDIYARTPNGGVQPEAVPGLLHDDGEVRGAERGEGIRWRDE